MDNKEFANQALEPIGNKKRCLWLSPGVKLYKGTTVKNCNDKDIKAIENPGLVAAIKRHYENNSNQSAEELTAELIKAKYLAAIINADLEYKEDMIQKGSTFNLGIIEDADGRSLLPIFTDWIHLNESVPGKSGFVMSAKRAFTMGKDEFDGVVINHTGLALPIYKNMLAYLLSFIKA